MINLDYFLSGNAKHTMMLANSIIGASILSMPFCFKQCGIILGSIILYLNSIMTKLCCHQLVKSSLISRRRNYEILAYDVMGPFGKLWIEVCIIGYNMGCCIAYLVVLGDLGPEILNKIGLNYSLQSARILLMAGSSMFIILPLSLLRDIETLNVMSTVSVAMYMLLVLKSFFEAGVQGLTEGISSNIEVWKMGGVLQCVPIFSMALSCQTQVFEVYDSLPEPSLKAMDRVVSTAIDLCTFIYMGVGIAGYLAFADTHFTGNILISFAPSFVTDLMKVGFLLSIILSFPLCVLPCRTSFHSLVYGKESLQTSDSSGGMAGGTTGSLSDFRFKILTFIIVTATLVIGICIPNVEFVLGLVGATLGTAVCCVAPAWIYLQVAPSTSGERWIAKVLFVCGLIILVLGTAANIYAEEEYSESHAEDIIPPSLREIEAKFDLPLPQSSPSVVMMDNFNRLGEKNEELESNNDVTAVTEELAISNISLAVVRSAVPAVQIQINRSIKSIERTTTSSHSAPVLPLNAK
ncbi:putative sodium-coupled neutral amino acid transporter 10 isoform X3 [Daphnia carinata]|uniref:putative sodium-coupled neutral amino acid transporter 10 isoform X3 n=1 Tax=Daphnia carinata TaxID=120202 RepID=UPI00257DF170|nr:putative sodium-coupled neutral amino acid transporter 10 isoform X3 [Daphnia carinata]